MIVDELKKSILNYALQGKLTTRLDTDSSIEKLLEIINNERRNIYISKKDILINEIEEKEIQFSIPKEWKWVRWGNLSNSIQYGVNSGAKNKGNAKLVRISDIQNNEIVWDNVPYCEVKDSDIQQYLLYENDILFARTGGTVGKSVIVKNIPTDVPYIFAGYLIRSNYNSNINYKYLKYFMESNLYWSQLKNGTIGSAQPNCNGQTLSNMILPLPPIEEQQRIVDKIEELFTKLDEIKPIEEKLKTVKEKFPNDMKKSILKDAFDGKYSTISFSEWVTDKLINACDEICTGNSISENIKKSKYTNLKDGYNYIGTKDLNFDHFFEYENGIKIPFEEPNFKYANVDDILLCIEGGSAGKKIGILEEKVCYGNKLCKFSSSKLNSKFLYYYLQSPQFIKNFYDNISGIIGGVSINKIKTIDISFPPLEEQQKIVDKLERLLPLCADIERIADYD